MDRLGDRNNTNYPRALKEAIKRIKHEESDVLTRHQKVAVQYLMESRVRGCMLLHEMGTGKTLIAVACAEYGLSHGMKVLFISSKSLHSNFAASVEKYYELGKKSMPQEHMSRYDFVTFNASNLIAKLRDVNFENVVIVMDEAHNFFNSITGGSEKAIYLYEKIMSAKRIKLVFLTGAGMVNHPFEVALGFNMLAGFSEGYSLFGEDYAIFNSYFIKNAAALDVDADPDMTMGIANADKFKARVFGLASVFKRNEEINRHFPKAYPLQLELVPMSTAQHAMYLAARDAELEENLKQVTRKKLEINKYRKPDSSSTTFKKKSREISNIFMPGSKLIRTDGKIIYEKSPNGVVFAGPYNKELLSNHSPKMLRLMQNIAAHLPDGMLDEFRTDRREIGIGIVYSEFLASGVDTVENILASYGMVRIRSPADLAKRTNRGSFAIQKGDVPMEERELLLRMFNSSENVKCDQISLYLYTATGAEGMDTKNVRHSHILESYWNWNRMAQVEARAIRYRSADGLPPDQRTVRSYMYLSVMAGKDQPLTTDQLLYKKALQTKKLLDSFMTAIHEASADCDDESMSNGKRVQCMICAPTNRLLYLPKLHLDMDAPCRCAPLEQESITAKKILVDDKEYAYVLEPELHIFEYSDRLGGFIEVKPSNPLYPRIKKAILES